MTEDHQRFARARIARGSGVSVYEVNQLVDRFFDARR